MCKGVGDVPHDEQDIKRVAREIERYLQSHPAAADSLEGVAKWWLTLQRYNNALATVQEALEYLIADGRIAKVKNPDGAYIYKKPRS